jgi:hypothetical protein
MQDSLFGESAQLAPKPSRFPLFNSAPMAPGLSVASMEIDEGDSSTLLQDLSLEDHRKAQTSAKSESREFEPRIRYESLVSARNSSFLSRLAKNMVQAVADVDDDTIRRIALFPHVISGYIQLIFNVSLPTFFLYWVYSFGCSIQSDVEKKVLLFSEEVMEQIAKCSRDYRENRCDPATRVPALVSACQAWEECMARDPHLVAKRSGISAEIFGETLNSFFNVLSWKTIISLILLIIGVSVIFNLTFSMSRNKPLRADTVVDGRGKAALVSSGSSSNSSRRRRH